jgi:hypothetical protein
MQSTKGRHTGSGRFVLERIQTCAAEMISFLLKNGELLTPKRQGTQAAALV